MLPLERHHVILKMKYQSFYSLLDSYIHLLKNYMLSSLYLFSKMSPEVSQDFFLLHTHFPSFFFASAGFSETFLKCTVFV